MRVLALAKPLPRYLEHALPWLTWLDQHFNLHPMLVSFTTALFTISLLTDVLGAATRRESFTITAWWTIFFAALITPFTGIFGWFFWAKNDGFKHSIGPMTIHMWLGTALVVAYIGMAIWRWQFYKKSRRPNVLYFVAAVIVFGSLLLQAKIGGDRSFPPPTSGWVSMRGMGQTPNAPAKALAVAYADRLC